MSLRRKILLAFLASAAIVAGLAVLLALNFAEIAAEIAFLEVTDTVRSKTLQLRRHEKNYFLYPATGEEEATAVRDYLDQLDALLGGAARGRAAALPPLVAAYRAQFARIRTLVAATGEESAALRARSPAYARVSGLVEANFLDKPLVDAAYLRADHEVPAGHRLVRDLEELDTRIAELRRTGEAMLGASKDLDAGAREKVDAAVRRSRLALFVLAPLFLAVGIAATALLARGIVRRLQVLAGLVEETGAGRFPVPPPALAAATGGDEVDLLTRQFYAMESQLQEHERELVQAKKLAAIGTLAAGVAHELNNPLNNISTTAQRLVRKAGDDTPPAVRKGLEEIFGQTRRMKTIVGDLLEFARVRESRFAPVELGETLRAAWQAVAGTRQTGAVRFLAELSPPEIVLAGDREQLERLFINLFTNAVDAMPEGGTLSVRADESDVVSVRVADTGGGIPPEALEKVFEPFYTTKERGTGLGLALAFGIVQRHGGSIRVVSGVGTGTTFTITLPRAAAPAGRVA